MALAVSGGVAEPLLDMIGIEDQFDVMEGAS